MSTAACLMTVTVTMLGLIYAALRRDPPSVPCVQLASVPRDQRRARRTFAMAAILALLLHMAPVSAPPPSEITASLVSKAPPSLRITAPFLSQAVAPLDALVPPFSNIQPAFAHPTEGITITKSAPTVVSQGLGGTPAEIPYAITLTNPSGYTISVGSVISDSLPLSTTLDGGAPSPSWLYGVSPSGDPYFKVDPNPINTTSYVGGFDVDVDSPIQDRTVITNYTYCFSGTVGITSTQFCENTPITTTVRAPDFSLTESWTSGSSVICAGQRLTYTISISNPGGVRTIEPFTVTGIITDPLTIYTDTLSADATSAGNVITWSLSSSLLANGGNTITRTFAVSVPASLAHGTYLTNTYTIASPEVAPTHDSWSSSGVTVTRVTAAFTNTFPVCSGATTVFTNTSGGATSYEWDFGDGSPVITDTNPTHVFTNTGTSPITRTVTLTATGICGTDITSTLITVNPSPQASFSAAPNPVCTDSTITFTNTSTNAATFLWDFGDGVTSTLSDPTHVYTASGTYTVWLTATSGLGCGSDVTSTLVTVNPSPQASFNPAPNPVCANDTITFTNTSTNTTTYLWDFGDGITSTLADPTHVYTVPGSYTVWLTATSGLGCGDDVTSTMVTVNPLPQASFSAAPNPVCANSSITFTNTSTNAATYLWDFGDGTTSSAISPTHVYTASGSYTVWLTATSGVGCGDDVTSTVVTVNPSPQASFSAAPNPVCANSTITFTNTSTNAATYLWDFGDGITATAISPTHVYTAPGSYTVWLTATSGIGCGDDVTSTVVTVNPLPQASFSAAPNPVCTNSTITFTNTSTNATTYLWDFGNGVTSTLLSPTHVYTAPGSYTVWLTATSGIGCGDDVTSTVVTVNPSPQASFSAAPNPVCTNSTIAFTNTSTNATTYLWDFGDGITSTLDNPTHVYTTSGSYTVWLTATSGVGCGTDVTSTVVTVNPLPQASFSAAPNPVCANSSITFTNSSTNATNYWWDFDDGSPITTTISPIHVYTNTGTLPITRTVTLTATGACGTDVTATVVTVNPLPQASFNAAPNPVFANDTITFTNTSTNATTYQWDFGDGSPVVTDTNPTHAYTVPSTYTVWLTATSGMGCGSDVTSTLVTVFAAPNITITKSAPAVASQRLGGVPARIFYAITLTNPSGNTIGTSSWITDSVPLSTTLAGGAPVLPWLYGVLPGGDPHFVNSALVITTSYVGGFDVQVDSPIRDRTIITNSTYCFTGTVNTILFRFCESTPITTEVRAPDFSLVESVVGAACASQRLTYTISISNPGGVDTVQPFTVIGFITDVLTIYTDSLSSDATSAGNVITWFITSDDLDANGGNTITRTFAVSVPGSLASGTYLTNTYTIASPEVVPTQDSWSSSGVTVSQVTAAFTSTSPVCLGGAIFFTNTGDIGSSYEWDLGDGSAIETSRDVSHTYATAGTFTVWLTTTVSGGCWDIYTDTVTVNPVPQASFNAAPNPVCANDTITFTNSSTDAATFLWDLGDGVTSTLPSPTHVYTAPGSYTVWLTATSGLGCGTDVTSTVVTVNPSPQASFSATPNPVCANSTITFTNSSTNAATYLWDLGDGVTSTLPSPTHVYTTPGSYTVWLTATSGVGCGTDVTSTVVTVNPTPQASFSAAPNPVCANSTITFTNTSTNSATYQWDFGDGTTSTAISPTHVYTAPGSYTVWLTATSGIGCGDDVTSTVVTVNPLPQAGFSAAPNPVCTNSTITFTNTSTNAATFLWDLGDGVTSTLPSPTHVYTAPGSYTVWLTATSGVGCGTDITSTVVTVNPTTVASFNAAPNPVCANDTVTFTNTSIGVGLSYQWDFGDGITSTAISPTHVYTNTGTAPITRTVTLTATGTCGTDVVTDTVVVNPQPGAFFTAPPPHCVGTAVNFINNSLNASSYQWDFGDGSPITTTVHPSHVYTSANTYTVWLTATSGLGCGSDVYSASLTINAFPAPILQISPNPASVWSTVYFTDAGVGGVLWDWDFGDGSPITTTATSTVTHVYTSTPGLYTVVMTSTGAGFCTSTTQQVLTLTAGLPYTVTLTASPVITWVGETAILTATVQDQYGNPVPNEVISFTTSSGLGSGGINPITATTNISGVATSAISSTTPGPKDVMAMAMSNNVTGTTTITFVAGLPYTVTVTASPSVICVSDSSSITATVEDQYGNPVADGTVVTFATSLGTLVPTTTLTLSGVATTALTSTSAGTATITATAGTVTGTTTVTVSPAPAVDLGVTGSPVCSGGTVTFTVTTTDVITYDLDFGDGVITTSVPATTTSVTHIYTATSPITYTALVTAAGGCGTTTDSVTVTVNPLSTASFSRTPVGSVCVNQVITFTDTSSGSPTSWLWSFGDGITSTQQHPTHTYGTTGTFTVWLTATNACGSDVISDTIIVSPLPAASFSRTPVGPVCVSEVITFTDTSSGSPTSWLWSFGDGITSTQQYPTHTYATTGTFTVWLTATNACGSDVTSDTITVGLSPSASFTSDSPVCLGQTMTFTNTGSVGTYLWSFGDGITSTVQNPTHLYGSSGSFTVWLTTTNACGSGVISNTVTVNPLPSVSFVSNSPVSLGQTMYFTNTGSIGTYLWSFGDGVTSTIQNPTHIYSATGSYAVWLTTTLGTGCWDIYSATVTVTTTTGCEDTYESDDSQAEATTVTPPSTTRHSFDDAADADWVRFWSTAGITYTIETLNLATNVDTKMNFYSWDTSTLTLLASDDDSGPGFASLITWVVTSTGWYYVEVGRFTGSYYGCDAYYDLRIAGPPSYIYLPIIIKNYPPPPPPTPVPPTPTPEPCYPMVEAEIPVGSNPHGVAIGNGMIYVANYGSDSVWVIRQSDYGLETTITPVDGANGVAYDGTHNLVYVTMRDSAQLAVIDASTNTVSETVGVGNGPNGVAYNPTANKIYVANYNSDTVTILHGDTRALITNLTASGATEPAHIAVNPVTNKVYVTYHGTGKVGVIDGDNNSLSIIDIYSAGPYGITVDTVRNLIYVATIDTHRIVAIGEKGGVPDSYLGWAEFHQGQDPSQPAPMRVIAVNPNLGSSGHLYATTDADDGGFNRFFAIPKGWPEGFHRPYAINVGNNPREGIAVNLSNNRVYVTARGSNRLTILEDGEPPCLWNFDLGFTVTLCRVGIDGDCR